MKRLNSHLSWLLEWKKLNFELSFKFVMIILRMTYVMLIIKTQTKYILGIER